MVKFLKLKIVPVLVSAVLALSPLALSASAATWEGSGSLGYTWWNATTGLPFYNQLSVTFPASTMLAGVSGRTLNGNRVQLNGVTWTSPVSIYVSGYYRNSYTSVIIEEVGNPYDPSNYEIKGTLDTGSVTYGTIEEVSIFTPTAPDYKTSSGISLVARIDASEGRPVSDLFLRPVNECGFVKTSSADASAGVAQSKGDWFWTSVRVIGAESAEELAALDNVASEIIAGNDILESMKGDLVAILQDIYREVGDLGVAANTTNLILGIIRDTLNGMATDVSNINISAMAIARMVQQRLPEILSAINSNGEIIAGKLDALIALLEEGTGEALEETNQDVAQGEVVLDGLGELEKPEVDSVVPELGDFSGDADVGSVSTFLGVIFSNSLVTSMLMVSLTMAFAAYVLYGKR